jgi:hydrogenase-4 component E
MNKAELLILLGILLGAYAMVSAKRMSSLVGSFRIQSCLLCLLTLLEATKGNYIELYVVSVLVFAIKVIGIPHFFYKMLKEIKVGENLGFFVNPQLSLIFSLIFTDLAWIFVGLVFPGTETIFKLFATVSFSIILIGMFIMISRIKALAQIIGILVMENGIFLLSSAFSGGMPFIVEMAIFLDVFISVIILGLFVYRINELFTGIDVDQLSRLKG